MGDILGAIFGTSSTTTQKTQVDPLTQMMNAEKYGQLQRLLASGSLYDYGGARPDLYSPTDTSNLISSEAARIAQTPLDYSNLLSLDEYQRSFQPVTDAYNTSLQRLDQTSNAAQAGNYRDYSMARGGLEGSVNDALNRSYYDYNAGVGGATYGYNTGTAAARSAYNTAIARGDYDLARSLMQSQGITNEALAMADRGALRSLTTQDFNRARALDLGLSETGNYVDMIARPRLEQVMALQGLESGAALPAAIARATAEQAMPYLQGIESAYGTNQANTLNSLMGLKGQLGENLVNVQGAATREAASGNRALGGQLLSSETALASNYQNNINQLAQALMANNVSLEQAGISAESALGQQLISAQNAVRLQQQQGGVNLANTYIPAAASFAQTLPGASSQLSLLPQAMQTARAANLTALQPLADFPRQLAEADFLRRQGLFTTAYTGIPYTPGGTVSGASGTGNIFDQLGSTLVSFGKNSVPNT